MNNFILNININLIINNEKKKDYKKLFTKNNEIKISIANYLLSCATNTRRNLSSKWALFTMSPLGLDTSS